MYHFIERGLHGFRVCRHENGFEPMVVIDFLPSAQSATKLACKLNLEAHHANA